MMDAVAQPNPFLPQFLGKARPRTQFDELWISNVEAAEQTPVGAYTIGQDVGIPAIVLGSGDTESVTQAVELPGIDRVYDEPPIDQRIDDRPMRYFDRHGGRTYRVGDREQPDARVKLNRLYPGM
jgi:hypothetical protein